MGSLETGDLGARGFLSTLMLFFFFFSKPSDSDAGTGLKPARALPERQNQ